MQQNFADGNRPTLDELYLGEKSECNHQVDYYDYVKY